MDARVKYNIYTYNNEKEGGFFMNCALKQKRRLIKTPFVYIKCGNVLLVRIHHLL